MCTLNACIILCMSTSVYITSLCDCENNYCAETADMRNCNSNEIVYHRLSYRVHIL